MPTAARKVMVSRLIHLEPALPLWCAGAEDLLWRAMALAIPCLARTPLQIAGPRFQAGVRPPWIGRRGPGDRFKAAENDSMKKRGSRIVGRGLSDCLSYFGFYSCSPCKLVGLLGGWGRKPAWSVLLAVKFDVRKDEQSSHPPSADEAAARTYVPHTLEHSHP